MEITSQYNFPRAITFRYMQYCSTPITKNVPKSVMHVVLNNFFSKHLLTEFQKETTTKDTTAALQSAKPTLVPP